MNTCVAPTRQQAGSGDSSRSVPISYKSGATWKEKINLHCHLPKVSVADYRNFMGVSEGHNGEAVEGEKGALSTMWLMKKYIFIFTPTLAVSQNTAVTAQSRILKDTRFLVLKTHT